MGHAAGGGAGRASTDAHPAAVAIVGRHCDRPNPEAVTEPDQAAVVRQPQSASAALSVPLPNWWSDPLKEGTHRPGRGTIGLMVA